MKKKSMAVIGLVVGCLMLVAGAAWANGPKETGTVNTNGTITIGNLVWLKNPNNCTGDMNWGAAMSRAKSLKSGDCGLTDGSKAGDWRLPTKDELQSIVDSKSPFRNVQNFYYWSSTTSANYTVYAWSVHMTFGITEYRDKTFDNYVWPVRNGP